MLDSTIQEQLKQVYSTLSKTIELRIPDSDHPKQSELVDILSDLAACAPTKIKVHRLEDRSPVPSFQIFCEGAPTGIEFQGIPGGHEFTTLVLAVLNAAGGGKLPDAAIQSQIRQMRGPISIQSYISLDCEVCPDVVQALNQIALFHPDFKHSIIDGALVPDQVQKLGIQGVPSIMVNDKLLHSGRITFLELLEKLKSHFGTDTTAASTITAPLELGHFDVAVIGGGPAGAAAAIYSARKGLKTALVAERFGGQVQDTKGIENWIGVQYTEGPQLAGQMREHVAQYGVTILEHRRVRSLSKGKAQTLSLESGETLQATQTIIASGAKWRELGVPGEKEYIGRGVAFCPHCDGPYYKGKKVVVVGGGNSGVEAAIDLAGLAREVVVLEFMDQLKADQVLVDKLKSLPNVAVMLNAKTDEVIGDGAKVVGLQITDRATQNRVRLDTDGVFVQIGLVPNSRFVQGVIETTRYGEIVVDHRGKTSEPGIYAAGDVTTVPFKQIIIAMGEGAKAALTAFEERMKSGA